MKLYEKSIKNEQKLIEKKIVKEKIKKENIEQKYLHLIYLLKIKVQNRKGSSLEMTQIPSRYPATINNYVRKIKILFKLIIKGIVFITK